MPRNTAWMLLCFVILGSRSVDSQTTPIESQISFGHRVEISSLHLGTARQVSIRLPSSYVAGEGAGASRYPVLYLLDGGDYFEPFAGVIQYLTMYDMIPEMIVVAVPHDDRMNELTFSPSNAENGNWPTSGGGDALQRFLAEELIPTIDRTYRTHPFRILVGHSLGGLFTVESLSRDPDLFQAGLAFSPSLYWNQFEWLESATTMLESEGERRQFLFISGEQKGDEETRRLAEFEQLAASRSPTGFEYTYTLFPDENHGSVAMPALFQNLKQLFEGWSLEEEAWAVGPEGVRAHYESLSDRFGFAVPIPEGYLVGQAVHGLHSHDAPDEAILLLEFCLSLYPESAGAHVGLGEAYETKGELEAAMRHYRLALEIEPDLDAALQRLADLERR